MAYSLRLLSIDALRGLTVAAMLLVNNAGDWDHVYPWLEHADWHGCTPADFIFPFFLLIVGISIALALGPKLDKGVPAADLRGEVVLRGLRLFLLGIALHVIAHLLLEGRAFRLLGVLQRIGICFMFAGLFFVHVLKPAVQWLVFFGILFGYWWLLGSGAGLLPDTNLADRLDTLLLGKLAYVYDAATGKAHDPEGILSTLPSLATVILGMRAGDWLRAGQIRRLCVAGVVAMLLGYIWSIVLPLNKQLWTSSFVLWTGGAALILVALAHYLIDRRGWPAIGRSLGVNSITAYAGSWIATCVLAGSGILQPLYVLVFEKPLAPVFGSEFSSFMFAAVFSGAFWLLMAWFQRRGWRFSI